MIIVALWIVNFMIGIPGEATALQHAVMVILLALGRLITNQVVVDWYAGRPFHTQNAICETAQLTV